MNFLSENCNRFRKMIYYKCGKDEVPGTVARKSLYSSTAF